MKRTVLKVGIAMLFVVGSATFIGCGNESNEHHDDMEHMEGDGHHHDGDHMEHGEEHAMYQCPMKCEGDKMYDEEGECPKCGMDLKEVEE